MDCAAVAPLIAAHGDNALGAVDRAATGSHLEKCESCRKGSDLVADRIGRLEAVLAGYRVRLGAVDDHVDTARAALGGRLRDIDLSAVWVALVLLVPGAVACGLAGTFAALNWEFWWFTDTSGFPHVVLWLAGTLVPLLGSVLLIAAWRRMRRESDRETAEGLLLAVTAGAAAMLAWWPFAGLLAEGAAGRIPVPYAGYRTTQSQLVHAHLGFGLLMLAIAVAVAAPMILRPALGTPHGGVAHSEPARLAVRSKLEDVLRLLALGCFERSGDLLDSSRIAEEELGVVATRMAETKDPDLTLRGWTQELAEEFIETPAEDRERSTMKLKKVAERRELESTLHTLDEVARAVAYLRLVIQVPLTRVQPLLGTDPNATARGFGRGLDAMQRFAHSPSDADGPSEKL